MSNTPSGFDLIPVNAQALPEIEAKEILMWDKDNPRSLINMLPEKPRTAIQNALWEEPSYFELDERDLYKKMRDENQSISPTDNRLRLKFWMEYDHAMQFGKKQIDMGRVSAGICSHEYFYGKYLSNPKKVAWLVCPPTGYMIKCNEALEFGLEKMREILEVPAKVGDKVDVKLGELQLKILQMLDVRVKGAPVQRNVQINANLHGKAAVAVANAGTRASMEELEARHKALLKQEQELLNGRAINITPQKTDKA